MERIAFWREELQGSRLYDERARDNFSRICAALEANSGASFSAACAGRLRQSGGRLFGTEKTTGEGLQHGHDEQTAQRSSGKEVVVAQDTTELNDTTHRAKTGLGQIGSVKSLRWGACAYGTCGRTRRGGAGCDWTKVLGASGCVRCKGGSASSDADRSQRELQVDRGIALGRTAVGASDEGHRGVRPRGRCI